MKLIVLRSATNRAPGRPWTLRGVRGGCSCHEDRCSPMCAIFALRDFNSFFWEKIAFPGKHQRGLAMIIYLLINQFSRICHHFQQLCSLICSLISLCAIDFFRNNVQFTENIKACAYRLLANWRAPKMTISKCSVRLLGCLVGLIWLLHHFCFQF